MSVGKPTENFADMDAPTLLGSLRDDAYRWAEAFCEIKRKRGWTIADIDEGLMVVWFANAIENSSDLRFRRAEIAAKGPTSPVVGPLVLM
jgi:hypothetical protein